MPQRAIAFGYHRRYEQHQWTMLIINGLRDKILKKKERIKDIAARTGLSIHTISKMMHGETKFPRHTTVVVLMRELGFKLYAEI